MNQTTINTKQFSAWRMLWLHLWPGVLGLIITLISEPIVENLGLPPLYKNVPRWIFLIVILIGYMLYLGKKKTGKLTLRGVVLYREPMPWWQYILFTVILLAWAFVVIMAMTPLSNALRETIFFWVPADAPQFDASLYSQTSLILMGILIMILNPLYGGVVEELYYRGYLLSRMSNLGVWAPLINVILWAALIHLGQPWDILAFILAFLPLVYVVWWKKNVYLSILVHTLGNLINVLMIGSMLFGLA